MGIARPADRADSRNRPTVGSHAGGCGVVGQGTGAQGAGTVNQATRRGPQGGRGRRGVIVRGRLDRRGHGKRGFVGKRASGVGGDIDDDGDVGAGAGID